MDSGMVSFRIPERRHERWVIPPALSMVTWAVRSLVPNALKSVIPQFNFPYLFNA